MIGFAVVGDAVQTIEKGDDLQLHVRRLEVDGEEFLDVREYVPSTETYARGVTVPAALKKQLLAALREA